MTTRRTAVAGMLAALFLGLTTAGATTTAASDSRSAATPAATPGESYKRT